MQPGGSLFITTINKTNLSYVLGIVVAEQLLRIVPDGTHDWEKFVSPVDLERLLESRKSLWREEKKEAPTDYRKQTKNAKVFFFLIIKWANLCGTK